MKKIEHRFINGIEERPCTKCKEYKTLDKFYKYNRNTNFYKLAYNCKECSKQKSKDLFYKNPEYQKKRRQLAIERAKKRKIELVNYKGNCCNRCKINHLPYINTGIFQFHHIDESTKEYNITKNLTHDIDKLKKEVDKCELLCANCHALHHYQEWQLHGKKVK